MSQLMPCLGMSEGGTPINQQKLHRKQVFVSLPIQKTVAEEVMDNDSSACNKFFHGASR